MATQYEQEVFGKCPNCGGDILQGKNNYYCSNYKKPEDGGKGCKVHLPKLILGHVFNNADARNFFKTMKTDTFEGITEDGDKVETFFVYDDEKKECVPKFNGEKQEPLGKCPKCGKDVYIGKMTYFCVGTNAETEPKCDFRIYRETMGSKFTPEMAKKLLAGEEIQDIESVTKAGDKKQASFRLGSDGALIKKS